MITSKRYLRGRGGLLRRIDAFGCSLLDRGAGRVSPVICTSSSFSWLRGSYPNIKNPLELSSNGFSVEAKLKYICKSPCVFTSLKIIHVTSLDN